MMQGSGLMASEAKKMKKEDSDGEKSDADLVVDDDGGGGGHDSKATGNGNGIHSSGGGGIANNNNGNRSPRENGGSNATNDAGSKKDPLSPSSARSTPASAGSLGKKDEQGGAAGSPGAGKILPPKSALGALAGKLRTLKIRLIHMLLTYILMKHSEGTGIFI